MMVQCPMTTTPLDDAIMSASLPNRALRTFGSATLVLISLMGTAALASERIDAVMVMVDHAKVIKLPEKTQTVIVGNPMIADVAVQKNGILVVTGRAFGITNMIALDAGGKMLAESRVTVRASTDALVTVQRGMERESYSCAPQCQPSIQLGDSTKYFGEVGGQTATRNQLSTPAR